MLAPELSPRASSLIAGLSILGLALASCGRSVAPIAPTAEPATASALASEPGGNEIAGRPDASFFYPLQIGNHWGYDHALTIYTIPEGGPPGPAFGQRDRRNRDLTCIENRSGRSYFVEENSSPQLRVVWWIRYRQDRSGLYEVDGDITLPPTCAAATGRRTFDAEAMASQSGDEAWAGLAARLTDPAEQLAYRGAWERVQARSSAIRRALGAEPDAALLARDRRGGVALGEITRLQYPLHRGAHWVIRADPRFESTVERHEVLDLAAGRFPSWRIRNDSELFGPDDRVHVWYGRSGLLKLVAHLEDVATDPAGNPIGRVIADESEVLVELSLDRGRLAAR